VAHFRPRQGYGETSPKRLRREGGRSRSFAFALCERRSRQSFEEVVVAGLDGADEEESLDDFPVDDFSLDDLSPDDLSLDALSDEALSDEPDFPPDASDEDFLG
jgi:hypothetical protein